MLEGLPPNNATHRLTLITDERRPNAHWRASGLSGMPRACSMSEATEGIGPRRLRTRRLN